MKLALNRESCAALRELADAIPMTAELLAEETAKLIATYQSVSGELGVHRNEFYLMLLHTQKALVLSEEALRVLPRKMHVTADKIDAYITAREHLDTYGYSEGGSSNTGGRPVSGSGGSGGASNVAATDTDASTASDSGGFSLVLNEESSNIGGSTASNSAGNERIAAEMVTAGHVRRADFGNLDSRTALDIQQTVSETLERFPDIDLHFVGSLQSRNQHIEKDLEERYLRVFRRDNPTVPDELLMPRVRELVSKRMKGFQPRENAIAQSLFISEPLDVGDRIVVAGYNGITINEKFGSDYNYFTEARQQGVAMKHKPEGCNTPKATVDHELGHQIAALTKAHEDQRLQTMFKEFEKLSYTMKGEVLSGYAAKDIHEFIAEGWSEYQNNPNCRRKAREIADILIDLYGQRNRKPVT